MEIISIPLFLFKLALIIFQQTVSLDAIGFGAISATAFFAVFDKAEIDDQTEQDDDDA